MTRWLISSSGLSVIGLALDIVGVIGLGVYSDRGASPLAGWGHQPRGPWWGRLSKASWVALVFGFGLQLVAQFAPK